MRGPRDARRAALGRLRGPHPDASGFTLVELLVVVLVVGVLAAIAVPTFLRQRQRAWDGASRAELKNAAAALEALHVESGSYGAGAVASNAATDLLPLTQQGFNLSEAFAAGSGGSFLVSVSGPGSSVYCVQVTHAAQPAVQWTLRSSLGSPRRVGTGTPAAVPC